MWIAICTWWHFFGRSKKLRPLQSINSYCRDLVPLGRTSWHLLVASDRHTWQAPFILKDAKWRPLQVEPPLHHDMWFINYMNAQITSSIVALYRRVIVVLYHWSHLLCVDLSQLHFGILHVHPYSYLTNITMIIVDFIYHGYLN